MKKYTKILIIYITIFILILSQITIAKKKEKIDYSIYNDLIIKIRKLKQYSYLYDRYEHTIYRIKKNNLYQIKDNEFEIILDLNLYLNEIEQKEIIFVTKIISRLIIQTSKNKIIVINLKDGKIKWFRDFKDKIVFKPIISKKKIIFDRNGDIIMALNIENGTFVWSYWHISENTKVNKNLKLKCDKKFLYYCYGNKRILIVNKKTGTKLRAFTTDYLREKSFIGLEMPVEIADFKINRYNVFVCYKDGIFTTINAKYIKLMKVRTKFKYEYINIKKNNLMILTKKNYIKLINKFNLKKIWKNKKLEPYEIMRFKFFKKNLLITGDTTGHIHVFNCKSGLLEKTVKLSSFIIKKIFVKRYTNIIYIFTEEEIFTIEYV